MAIDAQDEDRQPSTNSHYPAFVQHSGPGVPEHGPWTGRTAVLKEVCLQFVNVFSGCVRLSHRAGLPQQVAKEAKPNLLDICGSGVEIVCMSVAGDAQPSDLFSVP